MENMRKTLFLILVLCAKSAHADYTPSKEDCEMNADISSYTITISAYCGYERSSRYEHLLEINNKQCIELYGEPLTANASMAAIHSVKAEMAETGKNSACVRAYSEYRVFFE